MPPTVFRIAHRALALIAIRIAVAISGLAASLAVGADVGPATAALAFGACVTAVALVSDRRWLLMRQPSLEPLPTSADRGGLPSAVRRALLPSTLGVALLLGVSLAFEPILAAVLAGVLAGMGLAGAIGLVELGLWEQREHGRLFADVRDDARRYLDR